MKIHEQNTSEEIVHIDLTDRKNIERFLEGTEHSESVEDPPYIFENQISLFC